MGSGLQCPANVLGRLRRMWIRQPVLLQIVSAISALGIVGLAVLVLSDAGVPDVPLLPAAAVIAVIAVVRAFRAGVCLKDDRVTVHGYVWSRKINRAAIINVRTHDFPAVIWRREDGKQRMTPLIAFTHGKGNERRFEARVAPALNKLQAWAERGEP